VRNVLIGAWSSGGIVDPFLIGLNVALERRMVAGPGKTIQASLSENAGIARSTSRVRHNWKSSDILF